MTGRWLAIVVCALLAIAAGAWVLSLFVPADSVAPYTQAIPKPAPAGTDSTHPIAADQPPAVTATAPASDAGRFRLVGVVAPGASAGGSEGVALIAVDGKPAHAYSVGATVDGDIVVRGVSARGATLGPNGGNAANVLELSMAPAPGPGSGFGSQVPVDGLVQAQEVPTSARSKYPPIPPQAVPVPTRPGDGTAPRADDGSWRPPSTQ